MSRWLVTQGDRQYSVADLGELKRLAQSGRLGPGDMVQPPGANEWLYATELPELKGLLKHVPTDHDDQPRPQKNYAPILIVVLLILLAGTGYGFYHFASRVPKADDLKLLGQGGLALTEMLVTGDPATLRADPDENASSTGSVPKDTKVQLIAKRGKYYQVEHAGNRGWVKVDDVIPAYFFADKETQEDHDPIYNPDRYVWVENASWMQLPDQRRDNITVFQLMLANKSKFEMTDIILLATIKDKNGNVLEKAEVPLQGVISPFEETMLGTLAPPEGDKESAPQLMTEETFQKMAQQDEELHLRWSPGIEVQLKSTGFVEANIDLLQVRAVPKEI